MGKAFLYGKSKDDATPHAKLTVNCPANTLVRVQSNQTTAVLEKMSDDECKAIFTGLSEGQYTVSLPGVDHPPTEVVVVDGLEQEINAAFVGTITVTYPAGFICKCQKGDTVYTAPNTSGRWTVCVFETGEWVVTCDDGETIETTETRNTVISNDSRNVIVDFSRFSSQIHVTYPRGSTCTCTNGIIVLTDKDCSGTCVFSVPSAGEWTVTATNSVESDSEAVVVVDNGEKHSIDILYDLWMVSSNADRQTVPNTLSFHQKVSSGTGISRFEYKHHTYDLTKYSTLKVTASLVNGDVKVWFISPVTDMILVKLNAISVGSNSIDISSVDTEGMLVIQCRAPFEYIITDIVLEV